MTESSGQIRVLAVVAADQLESFSYKFEAFGIPAVLASNAVDLAQQTRNGERYHVVLLPAALPETDNWWSIWGSFIALDPRPAILVYAPRATFQLWSGVLESGGYDVVEEPLTNEKLLDAILRAAESVSRI